MIGRAGDTEHFHSDLHLLPDAQLGFFISYNSAGKTSNREAVWHAFLDRLPALPASGGRPGCRQGRGHSIVVLPLHSQPSFANNSCEGIYGREKPTYTATGMVRSASAT